MSMSPYIQFLRRHFEALADSRGSSRAARRARVQRRTRLQRRGAPLEFLEDRNLLAIDFTLVKDVNTSPASSTPTSVTQVGATTYFVATTATSGTELWKSDGTLAGTELVKDIEPGVGSSSPGNLVNANGTLFFSATTASGGTELWKSDGTSAGTVLVKDINAGAASASPSDLAYVGGALYFAANGGNNTGVELWASDGTEAGTRLVKNIGTGITASNPKLFTEANGIVFFSAITDVGTELWKTDGTEAGTSLVKDLNPGTAAGDPKSLVSFNNLLYFAASDATPGQGLGLWKSDGTSAGTVMVKRINDAGPTTNPNSLTVVGSQLFFAANDGTNGMELWVSDGTELGTTLVKNIATGGGASTPSNLTAFQGNLYFSADDVTNGRELWVSDGTTAGTTLLKNISGTTGDANPSNLTVVGSSLYFTATESLYGTELWMTDGTTANTALVKDIVSGVSSSSAGQLVNAAGTLVFRANDGVNGLEFWKSDGTSSGTVMVKDVAPGTRNSAAASLTNLNNSLFFTADDGTNGTELWSSDGTSAGTAIFRDFYPGSTTIGGVSTPNSGNPSNLIAFNNEIYFRATTSTNGTEVWKSDGTLANTAILKEIRSGVSGSAPLESTISSDFTIVGSKMYFAANDGTNGDELWSTDGTTSGTTLVKDIRSGATGSTPNHLTNVGGILFFAANDGSTGMELWKSDGTSAGTTLVKDIRASLGSELRNFISFDGKLYFSANDGSGHELWVSDGTTSGTVMLANISTAITGSSPARLTIVGSTLYFTANDGLTGTELWKTDGTTSGTLLVRDIHLGSTGSNPSNLTNVNGVLYFDADEGANGDELWKSGGTSATTSLVKDIATGATASSPENFANINGTLFFSANDGVNGRELWQSDGTSGGTVMAYDFTGDSSSSSPASIMSIGNSLYAVATSATAGQELFIAELTYAPTDITISASSVNENVATGTTVGTFSSADLNLGETHTYSLVVGTGDTDNWLFLVSSGALVTNTSLNFESRSSYSVRVRSTDKDGLTYEKAFTITVNDVNEAPTNVTLSNSSIAENQSSGVLVGTLSSTDADAGDSFSYSLVSGTGDTDNASFAIVGNALQSAASFDFEAKNSYSIRVRSTDAGGLTYDQVLTISVTDANEVATDISLVDSSIDENSAIGSAVGAFSTTDPDAGDTFTYTLVSGTGSGDNASFQVVGSELRSSAVFDLETDGVYSIRIRTTDAGGLSYEKVFAITVANVNEGPTNVSLSSTSVVENVASGTAIGTFTTTDVDSGDTFSYSLVSGTGDTDNASFQVSGNQLQTLAALNYEAKSSYSIRVLTTDAGGLSYEKSFTISVTNANEAPTSLSVSPSTVTEGQAIGTTVGTLSAADPDAGDTFTYSLVAGAGDTDNGNFQISGATVRTNAVLSYATKSSHSILVRVTDAGGATFDKQLTITVTDANDAPTDISLSGTTVAENSSAPTTVGTLSATDADPNETFTYALVAGTGGTDNASFQVSGSTLQAAASFNFEAKSSYSIRVRVSDSAGATFEKQFTLAVTNVNEAPTNISLGNSTIAENSGVGASVGSLSATDPDSGDTFTYSLVSGTGDTDNASFQIVNGVLQAAANFDYETKQSYSVRVLATDGGGLEFSKQFTISVTNANETPTDVSLTSTSIAENLGVGANVGTLSATDVDAGDSFTYALVSGLGSTDNGSFQISGSTLQAAVNLDFETKSSYLIRVRASDSGGLTIDKQFTITVTNVNEAPTNISLSASSMAENNAAGAAIGTLTATDQDASDSATYSLVAGTGDTDNASFAIVGGTLQAVGSFNFEAKSSYSIRVRATDAGGQTYDKQFTITVTNVNEAPTNVSLSNSFIAENSAANTTVGVLTATDQDAGDTFTYALVTGTGSTDNASFSLTGNSLVALSGFDFEAKSSYSIRVRATDAGGLTFEKQLSVTVTNVNETPTNINLSSTTIPSAATANTLVGNLTTVDPDSGDTFTYSLVSGVGSSDNSRFVIQGNALRASSTYTTPPSNSHSIRVRSTDANGLFFEKVFSIVVSNVNSAPVDIALSNATIAENAGANALVGALSTTDPNSNDTFSYSLVAGSGDADNANFQISGAQLRAIASLDFEAKPTHSVRIRTTDAGGLTFEKVFTITVTNVNEAPALTVDSATVSANEGSNATNSGTYADPEGSASVTLIASTGTITADANGTWSWSGATTDGPAAPTTVTITATDSQGLVSSTTFTYAVDNVDPTLTISGDATVADGATYTLNLASSDPGQDTLTGWTIDWGDGDTSTVAGNATTATHVYATNGYYSVSATATDEDGTYSSNGLSLQVGTSAFLISLAGDSSVDETSTHTYTFALDAPNSGAYTLVTSTAGTLGTVSNLQFDATTGQGSFDVTFGDGASGAKTPLKVQLSDGSGGLSNLAILFVNVNNVAPTASAGTGQTISEGDGLTLDASGSADIAGASDPLTYSWDINGDGVYGDATGVNPTLSASDLSTLGVNDGPNNFQVTVRVSDGDGGVTTSSAVVVSVASLPPTLTVSAPIDGFQGVVGQSRVLQLTTTDPSGVDTAAGFTYSINWGDGSAVETVTGSALRQIQHAYAATGTYTVTVTAQDKDGEVSAPATRQLTIVSQENQGGNQSFGGTNNNDQFIVEPDTVGVKATLNGVLIVSNFVPTIDGALFLYGNGGVDSALVRGSANADTIDIFDDGVAWNGIPVRGSIENWSVSGLAGNDVFYQSGGSATIVGGLGSDSLYGPDTATTWSITGTGAGAVGASGYSEMESLFGGGARDTLTRATGVNSWTLLGPDAGTVAGMPFAGFDVLQGGTGADTLLGHVTDNVWTLNGSQSGNVNGLEFTNMEVLTGSTLNDTFRFAAGAAGFTSLNGGTGTDTVTSTTGTNSFTISATVGSGTLNNIAFTGIEAYRGESTSDALVGRSVANTWNLTEDQGGTIGTLEFYGIETLQGGTAADILNGPNLAMNWTLTGTASGTVGGTTFTSMERLFGGADADAFTIVSSSVAGFTALSGGSGTDTVSGPNATSTWTITAADSVRYGASLTFAAMESIVAGTAIDTLVGRNAIVDWNLTGSRAGDADGLAFSGIESLTGGTSNDKFTLGPDASDFLSINAGNGVDTFCGSTNTTSFTLTAANNATVNGIPVAGVEVLVGRSSADTLTGLNTANTWQFSGDRAGTLATLAFQGMDAIVGGTLVDIVRGANMATSWTLTGSNAGSIGGTTFTRMEQLFGGAQADTFTVQTSTAAGFTTIHAGSGTDTVVGHGAEGAWAITAANTVRYQNLVFAAVEGVTGAAATDTLTGRNAATTWNLTGTAAGNADGISFTGVEALQGGTANDRFVVGAAAAGFTTLRGNGGTDTVAGAMTTNEFTYGGAGTVTLAGLTFGTIEAITGAGINDRLVGNSENLTWVVSGASTGTIAALRYAGIESLQGGSGNDTFSWRTSGSQAGSVDGGTGVNTLDYSAFGPTLPVTVDLTAGTATAVGAGVSNLRNVRGGAGNDQIRGDSQVNQLVGNAGNDLIWGEDGNDALEGSLGNDVLVGGDGNDTLTGQGGKDLLIGGAGADTLTGIDGEDLLIGGTTIHDSISTALLALIAEWAGPRAYTERVQRIKGVFADGFNAGYYLRANQDVLNDASVDTLTGGTQRDWFYRSVDDVFSGAGEPAADEYKELLS